MASSTERVLDDLQRVIGELEGILKSAAEAAGECAGDAARGLQDRIGQARVRLADVEETARKRVRRGLRTTDRYVRDNAWETLGAVAVVAFVAGLLMGRRE